MLQKLNERIQGIVAWVIVTLIALTFALFGVDYYMQSRHASTATVVVNGQPLSPQELELNYRRARQMQPPQKLTADTEKKLRSQVKEDMIVNTVSVQAARQYGFDVSSQQANSAILSIPQFQEEGRFSANRYQQALNNALFTSVSFQKEVQQGMLLNQQRFALIGTSFALPNELKRYVKLYLQTRDVQYLSLPVKKFMGQVTVTPKEIEFYYRKHQAQFISQEQVSVDYLTLSMQEVRKNIVVSEEEIKQHYAANQGNYLTPAKWKVAHILFSLPKDASSEKINAAMQKAEKVSHDLEKDPVKFSALAQSISDDKIAASKNGELPWISVGSPSFDKSLLALKQPGDLSKPVQTQSGIEIFKLVEYQPAIVKPLADVRKNIKELLVSEKVQNTYSRALETLTDLTYQTPDSLEPAAKALNLKVKTTKPFANQSNGPGFLKSEKVRNAAFSHDVLELENNSDPIQVDDDQVVVVRVNQHFPAKQKELAEVKENIASHLKDQKAEEKAKRLANALISSIEQKQSIEKVLKKHQLAWTSIVNLKRDSSRVEDEINQLAFAIPKVGLAKGAMNAQGDYVIVRLNKVHDGKLSALDAEQESSIISQLEASYGIMDYDFYISGLLKQAKISRN